MSQPSVHPQHDQFLRLYAEHEVALHTFVRSLLPTRQEASEVMQELIVALWQGFASADEFRPWAFGVARNLVRMHLRRRVRDRHVFDDELVNRLADMAVQQESQHLTEREVLEHCLQKLPQSQKELVLAAYTKGTRIDDLATRRGQTPMSLYKLLHRIRQALLDCVERTLSQEELA
jgi:RNA polymerase sigma-70 factor (ECF subfamily)|uniref:sigma-70 family RNA polymerase sigma factor n=1 Tax=Prosthecobacter sp. TaxID=1965333 RepID=UPI00378405A5